MKKEKIIESCPFCDNEVELENKFVKQICPSCGYNILPCSICEHTNKQGSHTECVTCPLQSFDGKNITNAFTYYENIAVVDGNGTEYFLSPKDLIKILSQHTFNVEKKIKRTWLTPIVVVETNNYLTDEEMETLSEVMSEFTRQTTIETGIQLLSGGFAMADFADANADWVYISLKWGVQSDSDNDLHIEDWKLDRKFLSKNLSIKEMVALISECN